MNNIRLIMKMLPKGKTSQIVNMFQRKKQRRNRMNMILTLIGIGASVVTYLTKNEKMKNVAKPMKKTMNNFQNRNNKTFQSGNFIAEFSEELAKLNDQTNVKQQQNQSQTNMNQQQHNLNNDGKESQQNESKHSDMI